jgi:hypothetical protein
VREYQKKNDMNADEPPPLPPRGAQKPVSGSRSSGARGSDDERERPLTPATPVPEAQTPAVAGKTNVPWYRNPKYIIPLVLICFPAGVFLVWKQPQWSKRTKWIWTGAGALVLMIAMIHNAQEEQNIKHSFADANVLWNSGKKAEAVRKYRELLALTTVPRGLDLALCRNRLITFDVEKGNLDKAKKLISQALDSGDNLSLESTQAQTLLVDARKSRGGDKLNVFKTLVKKYHAILPAGAGDDLSAG